MRSVIREYASQFTLGQVRDEKLLVGGEWSWRLSADFKEERWRYSGRWRTYAVVGETIWGSHEPNGFHKGWETAVLEDDRHWLTSSVKAPLIDVVLAEPPCWALGSWVLVYGTVVEERAWLGLLDTESGRIKRILDGAAEFSWSEDLVVCWNQSAVCAISNDGGILWTAVLGTEPLFACAVRTTRGIGVAVVGYSSGRLEGYSGEDGRVLWSRDLCGADWRGRGLSRGWLYSADGEILGVEVLTGEIVERFAGDGSKPNWEHRLCSWRNYVVQTFPSLGIIRIHNRASSGTVQWVLPPPFAVLWTEPIELAEGLVFDLSHTEVAMRGSLYGLLRLEDSLDHDPEVRVEPRPPHRIERFSTGKSSSGYRIAMRASDLVTLQRMGQVLVNEVAYHQGRTLWTKGDKEFDGTLEFAFDPAAAPPEAHATIDAAVTAWTSYLAGIVHACKGKKPITVSHIPFKPVLLAGV